MKIEKLPLSATVGSASRSGMQEHFVTPLTEYQEMRPTRYVKPDYPADAFAGTASYYARYRAPYPNALIEDLTKRSGITGEGRLLDLACGPGRVALSLASRFREVWAIDLEPEMIEVGRQEAEQRRIGNIRWMVGKAEELEAESASFELITIGEAFHRLDQWHIAKQALRWLSSGLLSGHDRVLQHQKWDGDVETNRLGHGKGNGWNRKGGREKDSMLPEPGRGPDHSQLVLKEAGFEEVFNYSFVEPHVWTVDSVIGNLFSTSVCSKKVLGGRVGAFQADLKDALLAHDAGGKYPRESKVRIYSWKKTNLIGRGKYAAGSSDSGS